MKDKSKLRIFLFCVFTALIVFAFFAHTLNYSWKLFDEEIIFKELLLPIPKSFSELIEIVSLFGINNHFIASNAFYSDITNIRSLNLGTLFNLNVLWLFKDSSFKYHLFMLVLHIINSCLCLLIIYKSFSGSVKTLGKNYKVTISFLLTLIWALHPANIESILFATNYGALVTYFFCFLFFLYYTNLLERKDLQTYKAPISHKIALFVLYLFPLFLHEQSVILPVILFIYVFLQFSASNIGFKTNFFFALKNTLPLFWGLAIYIGFFLISSPIKIQNEHGILLSVERILWLSPQIFFHLLKLAIYPVKLSIDQTTLVMLSENTFGAYAVFCSLFMYLFIVFVLISLLLSRKNKVFYCFSTFSLFFLSLLPFLHIISPAYNLASERYLYLPIFFLVFSLSKILSIFPNCLEKKQCKYALTLTLIVILLGLGTKAYSRSLDWKDSSTLFSSAIKTAPNGLFKALREQMIVRALKIFQGNNQNTTYKSYSEDALIHLKEANLEFENKKNKYQKTTPEIIRFYGLDPQTLQAKCAFLNALIELDSNGSPQKALEIFEPYVNQLQVLDTEVLGFYYRVLFNTNNIDKAEKILGQALGQSQISSTLFVALSDLYEYKYKDSKQAEEYLLKSFKYFPYDANTLYGLRRLYGKLNDTKQFVHFSYLFGLRLHNQQSLNDALLGYLFLSDKEKSKKILHDLLINYPVTQNTLQLKEIYEKRFGSI